MRRKGRGPPAAGSRPTPARTDRVHDAAAGRDTRSRLPGPAHFSRVVERKKLSGERKRFRWSTRSGAGDHWASRPGRFGTGRRSPVSPRVALADGNVCQVRARMSGPLRGKCPRKGNIGWQAGPEVRGPLTNPNAMTGEEPPREFRAEDRDALRWNPGSALLQVRRNGTRRCKRC